MSEKDNPSPLPLDALPESPAEPQPPVELPPPPLWVIAYSVWGADPLYCQGIVENLLLAPKIYPGWQVWVYHDDSVPEQLLTGIRNRRGRTIRVESSRGAWDGLFWRFYPASEPSVGRLIVRDADSRLNAREAAAVTQWVDSARPFHAMRDHLLHNVPIMGGMWGVAGNLMRDVRALAGKWGRYADKGEDQLFLAKWYWPRVRPWAIVHDRHHDGVVKLPDGQIVAFASLAEYNPWNNCGDQQLRQFPDGRIVLADGRQFQRLQCHVYRPRVDFEEHDVRPFPPHSPMGHGTYVGEDIKVKP